MFVLRVKSYLNYMYSGVVFFSTGVWYTRVLARFCRRTHQLTYTLGNTS